MPGVYIINQGERVLLLGEGNFSFSKDLVILNEPVLSDKSNEVEIVTTCKENSSFEGFDKKTETVEFLLLKGVKVIFNVDATNLKHEPELQNRKFNKIIFNFPHVGGKMKIHLNRQLLKDFFSSARDVLEEHGAVVVALCDGQGGTEADKKQRRWDDTWQITEMAAQSDLLLKEVEIFDIASFPNYTNVGFRSLDKSFHNENAIVHIFRKGNPPSFLDRDTQVLSYDKLDEDLVFDFLNDSLQNPYSNPHSASSYVFESFKEKLNQHFNFFDTVLKYQSSLNPFDMPSINNSKPTLERLFDIFCEVKRDCSASNNIAIKALAISNSIDLSNFSSIHMNCQILLFGNKTCFSMFLEFVSEMISLFKCIGHVRVVESEQNKAISKIFLGNEPDSLCIVDGYMLPNGVLCQILEVDNFAKVLFRLTECRYLWTGSVNTSSRPPTFQPASLFPRSYVFDLSLSIPTHLKEEFDQKFHLVLWLLAGDIIVKLEHISTYLPSDRNLICHCYRIYYKSYNAPIYRKRVVYIHEGFIAKLLCKHLKVHLNN